MATVQSCAAAAAVNRVGGSRLLPPQTAEPPAPTLLDSPPRPKGFSPVSHPVNVHTMIRNTHQWQFNTLNITGQKGVVSLIRLSPCSLGGGVHQLV